MTAPEPQAQWPKMGYVTAATKVARTRYPPKRMRSATAPDMSVVAVAMNPSWNRKNAVRNALSLSNVNDDEPTRPAASTPNMRPKPNSQKSDDATRKLAKFLIATLIEFFERTRPLSSAVKPACMNRTRAAETSSQAMSTGAACGIQFCLRVKSEPAGVLRLKTTVHLLSLQLRTPRTAGVAFDVRTTAAERRFV